jgi:uncharacterized membrane protein YeaQ/YmgE (transglycosylase-associated protein family)
LLSSDRPPAPLPLYGRARRPGPLQEGDPPMLDVLVWFLAGGVIGAVAGVLVRGDDDSGVFANVMVGIVGALAAGRLVAPWIGMQVTRPLVLDLAALAVALVGAMALLTLVTRLRRARRG